MSLVLNERKIKPKNSGMFCVTRLFCLLLATNTVAAERLNINPVHAGKVIVLGTISLACMFAAHPPVSHGAPSKFSIEKGLVFGLTAWGCSLVGSEKFLGYACNLDGQDIVPGDRWRARFLSLFLVAPIIYGGYVWRHYLHKY